VAWKSASATPFSMASPLCRFETRSPPAMCQGR
jgi:hypothetical protein